MKILLVFGTRPEAIKLLPIINLLQTRVELGEVESIVCVTAQHREMLDQVLNLFKVSVDYDLDLMVKDQTPSSVASVVMSALEGVIQEESPDWVVVQGDTTTVASAALASFYSGVPVAHVEAGLRTYDRKKPFPEEINRRLASILSDVHFAPTSSAAQNLVSERIDRSKIFVTGNTVIDALNMALSSPIPAAITSLLNEQGKNSKIVLVTAHRRENFGEPLENISLAISDIARELKDSCHIVFPVHPNPKVSGPILNQLGNVKGVTLLPPLDYLSAAHLMNRSYLILTDSGGIQEEAPSLGKPVLVLRDITERPEAIEAGTASLVGTDRDRIVKETIGLIEDYDKYLGMARAVNPYGDGLASQRIVAGLLGEQFEEFVPEQM